MKEVIVHLANQSLQRNQKDLEELLLHEVRLREFLVYLAADLQGVFHFWVFHFWNFCYPMKLSSHLQMKNGLSERNSKRKEFRKSYN